MRIAIINTGGTISCVGTPLAPMTAQAFAQASQALLTPILQQQFPALQVDYLTNVAFPESASQTLDSTNLQPSDWCIMARAVLQNYAQYDGFVILHGTDSMDFSGPALTFLLQSFDSQGQLQAALSKPVILTGSQSPLYHQNAQQALSLNFNTDAFQNMCGAIACAQSGVAEVGVYFHNQLLRGSRVVKINANQFYAFDSPNYPALARYGITLQWLGDACAPPPVSAARSLDNPSVLTQQRQQLDHVQQLISQWPIAMFSAFPAPYSVGGPACFMASAITALAASGAKGIVLQSYGEGNFPSGDPDHPSQGAIYQALLKAQQSGVYLVDCTQVLAGSVNCNAYAAGAWLPQVGALAPADMTPMAALTKLMVLLVYAQRQGWSRETVCTLMQSNLAGEMQSVNTLDSRGHAVLRPGQSLYALDGSASLINHPAQGPLLLAADGHTVLWRPPLDVAASQLPGQLRMQDDGNLVFYSRNNAALWASNTGVASGASSRLMINGSQSSTPATLALQIYDYSHQRCTASLYPLTPPPSLRGAQHDSSTMAFETERPARAR